MIFTEESQMVQSYVLLIERKFKVLDDVPVFFNLKDVVEEVINRKEDKEDVVEAPTEEK